MEHKFKVCSGVSIIILAIVLGIVNIGVPIALIVRYVVIWEGVGKLIGMCFVALIAMVIFSVPTFFLNIVVWDYIKVEGTTMNIRDGFRNRFVADCSELTKVRYHKEISMKGQLKQHIILNFRDKEIDILHGKKNFKMLARYLCQMHDAGYISEEVINTRNKNEIRRLYDI